MMFAFSAVVEVAKESPTKGTLVQPANDIVAGATKREGENNVFPLGWKVPELFLLAFGVGWETSAPEGMKTNVLQICHTYNCTFLAGFTFALSWGECKTKVTGVCWATVVDAGRRCCCPEETDRQTDTTETEDTERRKERNTEMLENRDRTPLRYRRQAESSLLAPRG